MPKRKNPTNKKPETTSKRVAKEAGQALRDPKASKREKSIAGSALTQVEDKAKRKKCIDDLFYAVQRYIEGEGGTVVVAGPVTIQQWPGDRKFNYYLAIRCTGRPPLHRKRR